jgi:hypothetical protein
MACAYLGIPNARIAWLDLDYSSFVLAHLLGADYRDVGPLVLLDQEGGLEWICGWFERPFARWNFEMDERQAEEFTFALREARRHGVRTLSGLRAFIPGEQGRIRSTTTPGAKRVGGPHENSVHSSTNSSRFRISSDGVEGICGEGRRIGGMALLRQ